MTAKKTVKKTPEKFVTVEQFSALEASVGKVADLLGDFLTKNAEAKAAIPETPQQKEVKKAGPDETPVNPEWDEKAKEIIGDAVDHCEVKYLKSGGVIFTVVIKKEMSNASKDYLDKVGSDRRSKEISAEGLEGVEQWCKLIKQNLNRPH